MMRAVGFRTPGDKVEVVTASGDSVELDRALAIECAHAIVRKFRPRAGYIETTEKTVRIATDSGGEVRLGRALAIQYARSILESYGAKPTPGRVFELVERHQPHNQGWEEPAPTSRGLFATAEGAKAKADEIAHAELLEIQPRDLLP